MNSADDLRHFREMAERFAKKELEAGAVELDNYPFVAFNRNALETAQQTGLLSIMLPEDKGGVGQGMAALCEVLMSLAQADASFAAIVFMNTLAQTAITRWAKSGVAEKHAGSIVALPAYDCPADLQQSVEAEKDTGGFTLSGKLDYVALAPAADALLVPSLVSGSEDVCFFMVDANAGGVKTTEPVISLGLRGCPAADVVFENARVPSDSLLCEEGSVRFGALAAEFRPAAAAMAAGVCEGSYQAAKAYAKDRYQGGATIINYDMVRQMLANLAVAAETGRALVRRMAEAVDEGVPWPICDAGLVSVSEQAARATTDGVQILGGYGYMEDYGQEKRMRDAKQIANIFGAPPAKRLQLMEDVIRQEE